LKSRGLDTFDKEQHAVASGLLPKLLERLIFRRSVPSVDGIHIWEFHDEDQFWGPTTSLWPLVCALGQVAAAVLRDSASVRS
jgi:hypothetical protein